MAGIEPRQNQKNLPFIDGLDLFSKQELSPRGDSGEGRVRNG
jgi:hypothetical protein